MKIQGSLVAVVSPMKADGSLDFDAYRNLLDWHIESGTSAIVAVGTTGESPTVSVEEHAQLIRVAAEHCRGRVPVIAGTGANSTREAIELTRLDEPPQDPALGFQLFQGLGHSGREQGGGSL